MHVAYIGLGSNLGDRRKNIEAAAKQLRRIGAVRVSSIYETAPLPPAMPSDPSFLNCVVELKTRLSLAELASACGKIAGKEKKAKGAPRKIDADILLYDGGRKQRIERLVVPHPRMLERKFVLLPLAELAPGMKIKGKNLRHYLREVSGQAVKKMLNGG